MALNAPFPYHLDPEIKAFVYMLINPFTNKYFYIGSTRNSLKRRLAGHIRNRFNCKGGAKKNKIIRDILKRGKEPIIKEICRCPLSLQFKKEGYYKRKVGPIKKISPQ